MTGFPPNNLIIKRPLNITGKYRLCEHVGCEKYIPCPFVKCQQHRTDFAMKDTKVIAWGE